MQKVFLSHSSQDKESYIRKVYDKLVAFLGEHSVILDEISFGQGRKTAEEIEKKLEETDLFVFFCSNSALDSTWVQKELKKAYELLSEEKLTQICPIIIDPYINYNDKRIPEWLRESHNIKFISSPVKAAKIIQERMVELSFERHPKLKEREEIFVGRNDLINSFEERMDDFTKTKPICVVASGIKSIGRKTLIKHCIVKSNIKDNTYPFAHISMNYDESIEDFILKIYDLGYIEKINIEDLMTKNLDNKITIAIELINQIQIQDDILFVEDNGAIINHDGQLANWIMDILKSNLLKDKLTICIISKFRLNHLFPTSVIYDKIFSLQVGELAKKERDGLLNRYLEFEEIDYLELDEKKLISGLLVGFPEQVFYAVTLLKDKGISYLKKNTHEIVDYNDKKASSVMRDIEGDKNKVSFLALLSMFDYIGIKYICDIVENEKIYIKYLDEFISKSLCEYVGIAKEYIRVNETIKDYVVRNNYKVNNKHNDNISTSVDNFLKNLSMDDYDIPEYLFSLKKALIDNKKIDKKHLVPSLYLKTMIDLYNKKKNKEVVMFADKALENEEYMDARIVFEIRYLLCSALAKQRDTRFISEVSKINGADFDFLYGFYYRQIGQFEKSLKYINSSMEKRPNFSKAKRELVQIYIGMQEFQKATELAKENYLNYKDNPYHIQAYFSCLVKAEKSKDNKEILDILVTSLDGINSDVAQEMTLRCKAQMSAFYNDNQEDALRYIDKAIEINHNIHYARMVKFDICEKFNLKSEMEEIINFFSQPEYRVKYHNNIICFKSIMMAKNKEVDKAVSYFKQNIKHYTDEAKDKFVIRLNKYVDKENIN